MFSERTESLKEVDSIAAHSERKSEHSYGRSIASVRSNSTYVGTIYKEELERYYVQHFGICNNKIRFELILPIVA